jgi:hypothetical protein
MNQVGNRSEKSSTFFGGSNFNRLNNYDFFMVFSLFSKYDITQNPISQVEYR